MRQVPTTMGQLRKMLAETLHEVRYGHIPPAQGIAVAKIGAQIANLIAAEIDACRFLAEAGQHTENLGELPLNKVQTIGTRVVPEEP